MPILRNKLTWLPLYLFIISFLCINYGRKGLLTVLVLILVVSLTDSLSSRVLKKSVKRARPCKVIVQPKDMNLLVPCGGGYSFPSSHATNHFGVAAFLIFTVGQIFRWIKIPLLLWAGLVSIAQVYVGLHYPLDILFGGMIGCLVAWAVHLLSGNWTLGKIAAPAEIKK